MSTRSPIARHRKWLFIVFACHLLAACSLDDTPALRVGTTLWAGYEPMQLAQQLGYYDADQIKLVGFPSAVEVIRAYRNGAIDLAALTADEALSIAVAAPDRHGIILVADYSNGGDAIIAQAPFASMHDLRGKRVAAELTAFGALMLARALEKNDMKPSDITIVPLSLEEHAAAFATGQVDAVLTFDPLRSRSLAAGAHEVFSTKEIPWEIVDVIVGRKELLRSRSGQVEKFVAGWFRAVDTMNRDPGPAAVRLAPRYGVSPDDFTKMQQGLKLLDANANRRLLVQGELTGRLAALSQIMLRNALLPSEPKLDTLSDGSFVASVNR